MTDLLTVTKAAPRLGISKSKLYQLIELRQIQHFRIGGKILFSLDQINAFLNGCLVEKAEAPAVTGPLKYLR